MRLSAALLQATFAQTELSIDSDLIAMREWAEQFQLFAGQQALCHLQTALNLL